MHIRAVVPVLALITAGKGKSMRIVFAILLVMYGQLARHRRTHARDCDDKGIR